jgi:hypothetical protein
MTPDEAFSLLFASADVIVAVDDWKVSLTSVDPGTWYFVGRTFHRADPDLEDTLRLLWESNAPRWHGSGNRGAADSFLFDSSRFNAIFKWLNTGKTCRYDMLVSARALATEKVQTKWRSILAEHPELKALWGVDTTQAPALFRFISFLAARLLSDLPQGTRVCFVLDRLDWISGRTNARGGAAAGILVLPFLDQRIPTEVLCVADKSAKNAEPYLALVGLVDSEAWAFGRLNSLRLPDGTPIRDHYVEAHSRAEAAAVSEDDFQKAFGPHRGHANLLEYLEALKDWAGSRSFCLKEERA